MKNRAEKAHEEKLQGQILVVDDEESNRLLLCRRLKRRGFDVDEARDGPEALNKIRRQEYALVLLDLMLPGMDGIEVLKEIRKEHLPGELPVIMISAKDESKGIVEALNSGANDYITKPLDFPIVLARIKNQLAHRADKKALKESEERYALAMAGANDGLWDWNLRTNEIYYSPRWKSMLGLSDHEADGTPKAWFDRVHPDDLSRLKKELEAHINNHVDKFESEYRILHADGSYRWFLTRGMAVRDEKGIPYRIAGSHSDITARKVYDPLTGLPNRILFMDRLSHCLKRFKRSKNYQFAVLLLDLDRFKIVNDSLGHKIGDQLLIHLARRLSLCVRTGDTIARFGGDEFTILLDDIRDASDAIRVAERIQQSLKTPFHLEGHEVFTTTSAGIALSATGYDTADDVVRDADTAMNRAKALGKARHEMFDRAMHTQSTKRLKLETDLRRAIERKEFVVFYQAIVSLDDEKITGFEALVRWQHPVKGQIPPDDFIPVAEETGLIVPIDLLVLEEACRQTQKWRQKYGPLTISVNLSAKHFAMPAVLDHVDNVLKQTALPPEALKIEITESALMENAQTAEAIFNELKRRKIKLGLDDFGTGYSSLSYLHRFPLDTLKIDRSFISRMDSLGENAAIVRTIVNLAQNMDFQTVAEGIETVSQFDSLKELECLYGQGYYFSKPMPPEEAEKLLKQGPSLESILQKEPQPINKNKHSKPSVVNSNAGVDNG